MDADTNYSLGKQWKPLKSAFRPKMGNDTYEKRQRERKALEATKAKEKEMKEEKAAEQLVRFPTFTSPTTPASHSLFCRRWRSDEGGRGERNG